MKPIKIITFLFILSFLATSCAITPKETVDYLSTPSQGVVVLRASGSGINSSTAAQDASLKAVKKLLFIGLPNSPQQNAMVEGGESSFKKKNSRYFKEFMNSEYKKFVMTNVLDAKIAEKNSYYEAFYEVKINVNALRKSLEKKNVIPKFGFR
ncbi:MAG: hypothetical protein ACRBFS_12345 [Aureispira sp.]